MKNDYFHVFFVFFVYLFIFFPMRFSQLFGEQREKMHNTWDATYRSTVGVPVIKDSP